MKNNARLIGLHLSFIKNSEATVPVLPAGTVAGSGAVKSLMPPPIPGAPVKPTGFLPKIKRFASNWVLPRVVKPFAGFEAAKVFVRTPEENALNWAHQLPERFAGRTEKEPVDKNLLSLSAKGLGAAWDIATDPVNYAMSAAMHVPGLFSRQYRQAMTDPQARVELEKAVESQQQIPIQDRNTPLNNYLRWMNSRTNFGDAPVQAWQ